MSAIWLSSDLLGLLTWVLMHSLWQGAVWALVVWVSLRTIPASRPRLRYGVSVCALALIVLSCLVSWAVLEWRQESRISLLPSATEAPVGDAAPGGDSAASEGPSRTVAPGAGKVMPVVHGRPDSAETDWEAWVALAWMAGAAFMIARLVISVCQGRGLIKTSDDLADADLRRLVEDTRREIGLLGPVRVLVCGAIEIPSVVGAFWPVLLLPPSLMTGVPVEQLRVIVTHELAHIRRYDYLVDVCQRLVEAVLFFNPAVWWISRQVRVEREACCDAFAVRAVGDPLVVARTLGDFADRLRGVCPSLAPGPAFGADGRDGSLLGRVRRVVSADPRPSPRLPWYSLGGLLVVLGLLFLGIKIGTRSAVVAAADWLTKPEHIEQLADLEKTHGAAPLSDELAPGDKPHLTVAVRTSDGSPLPPKTSVWVSARHARGVTGISLRPERAEKPGDTVKYAAKVVPGRVLVLACADGFAPAWLPSFEAGPGETIGDKELVLERGFTAKLTVTDEEGQPIPAAKVRGGFKCEEQSIGNQDLASDERGEAVITRCPNLPFNAHLNARGFQEEVISVVLESDAVTPLKMRRAAPASGVVRSQETGAPIAGAEVGMVHRRGPPGYGACFDPHDHYSRPPVLATSDDAGRFVLDTLRDGCEHAILVRKPGYAWTIREDVRAGSNGMVISLGPPRFVRGRILGKLDQLKKRRLDGKTVPSVSFANPFRVGSSRCGFQRWARVDVTDGVGLFVLSDLLPEPVTLHLPGKTIRLQPNPSIDVWRG